MNQRTAILVLGMHRSGTSAVARIVSLLGAKLPRHLPPPADDNVTGFWESPSVVSLNERILGELRAHWSSSFELNVSGSAAFSSHVSEASSTLVAEYGDADFVVIKDPRMCRLLPVWRKALADCGYFVKCLFPLRNPLEVAESLTKRNGLPQLSGLYLWGRYTLDSIEHSQELERLPIAYDRLLSDPANTVDKLRHFCGLEAQPLPEATLDRINQFLDPTLRHHERPWTDVQLIPNVPTPVKALAQLVQDWCDDIECPLDIGAVLDRWRADEHLIREISLRDERALSLLEQLNVGNAELRQERAATTQMTQEVHRLNQEIQQLLQENTRLAKERGQLKGEVQLHAAKAASLEQQAKGFEEQLRLITSSRSWRATVPFRLAARTFREKGITTNDQLTFIRFRDQLLRKIPLPRAFRTSLRSLAVALRRQTDSSQASAGDSVGSLLTAKGDAVNRPSRPPLAPRQNAHPDILMWAVIDWDFRIQRPQHLARELSAAGFRVFYVSNVFLNCQESGFEVEPLDSTGRLFRIRLNLKGAPAIYDKTLMVKELSQLRWGIADVLKWTASHRVISIIHHPFWFPLARLLPNAQTIYDCMDYHQGFGNTAEEMLSLERAMLDESDLVVVTSQDLYDLTTKHRVDAVIVRNAGQYKDFATRPDKVFRDALRRKVIGYFGAIAEWMDLDLVEAIASRFADCAVVLVGADTAGAHRRLKHCKNVTLVGEVRYDALPYYLYGFDVCLLPFKIVPLTIATNPVKVYEYLAAGKPVVSVDLPELRRLGGLVRIARETDEFLDAIGSALDPEPEVERLEVDRRRSFAKEQTWSHRALELMNRIRHLPEPLVSVIIVTFNNCGLTRVCLESLERFSDYASLELIVVDNSSTDGSQEFLRSWERSGSGRTVILNETNRGFAAANNQGLRIAKGDFLTLLNNDTHVTPGWIRTLVNHLRRDKTIGLIGPVTNNIGNEARIDLQYGDMAEMLDVAGDYVLNHIGETFPLRTAALFCAMMPRDTYERVGELDEVFGVGFFEDDDYCRRVEAAGMRIVCAEDVFIHHHLSASFDNMAKEARQRLFEENKRVYESKWGPWVPHKYR